MGAKILRWVIFGAIVSLLPLVFAWVTLALTSQAKPPQNPDLGKVLGNGELLVVVWVLSASAIGELFGSGKNFRHAKIITGGFTFIIILVSTALFSWVVEAKSTNQAFNETLLVKYSIYFYLASIVSCIGCLLCSKEEE